MGKKVIFAVLGATGVIAIAKVSEMYGAVKCALVMAGSEERHDRIMEAAKGIFETLERAKEKFAEN